MPANEVQWLWFAFFAIGALGGIAYLVDKVRDVSRTIRAMRWSDD